MLLPLKFAHKDLVELQTYIVCSSNCCLLKCHSRMFEKARADRKQTFSICNLPLCFASHEASSPVSNSPRFACNFYLLLTLVNFSKSLPRREECTNVDRQPEEEMCCVYPHDSSDGRLTFCLNLLKASRMFPCWVEMN